MGQAMLIEFANIAQDQSVAILAQRWAEVKTLRIITVLLGNPAAVVDRYGCKVNLALL
ncbi:hypothetical protein DFE_3183 [Desulfovibrio ferrophilus]|uniref:Uncharacterized protein n=2 Tax=Desulfovibrio ferrophilus TaxID=241368 RepID=A0A2Z6B320_9BACT|nr:hypothetical protein DFE_3183 [Desulfovibrio ferrophilus]